eukprot:s271_g11.t1
MSSFMESGSFSTATLLFRNYIRKSTSLSQSGCQLQILLAQAVSTSISFAQE